MLSLNKNVIIGFAKDYNYYHVFRFLESLKRIEYDGDIVFFVGNDIKRRTRRRLKSRGVLLVEHDEVYPYVKDLRLVVDDVLINEKLHVFNYRHVLYYDFLLKSEGKYKNVMLSDTRDVVFQRNPFDCLNEEAIYFAMENRNMTLSDVRINLRWLRSGYNEDVVEGIKGNTISCAGTVLAPYQSMLGYLDLMLKQIAVVRDKYNCIDQAIHNYLLHTEKFDKIVKCYNEDGPVLTMALVDQFVVNRDGEFLTENGKVACVLHQYDRSKISKHIVDEKLFKNIFLKYYEKIVSKVLG